MDTSMKGARTLEGEEEFDIDAFLSAGLILDKEPGIKSKDKDANPSHAKEPSMPTINGLGDEPTRSQLDAILTYGTPDITDVEAIEEIEAEQDGEDRDTEIEELTDDVIEIDEGVKPVSVSNEGSTRVKDKVAMRPSEDDDKKDFGVLCFFENQIENFINFDSKILDESKNLLLEEFKKLTTEAYDLITFVEEVDNEEAYEAFVKSFAKAYEQFTRIIKYSGIGNARVIYDSLKGMTDKIDATLKLKFKLKRDRSETPFQLAEGERVKAEGERIKKAFLEGDMRENGSVISGAIAVSSPAIVPTPKPRATIVVRQKSSNAVKAGDAAA